jgi:hypothetical protein
MTKKATRKPTITVQLTVGLKPEQAQALAVLCEFQGMTPAQAARQFIVEGLVARQCLEHPMKKMAANTAGA